MSGIESWDPKVNFGQQNRGINFTINSYDHYNIQLKYNYIIS